MKIISLKFKIIIGIVLFIIIVCMAYYEKFVIKISKVSTNISNEISNVEVEEKSSQIGLVQYKGKFLIPVENFKNVSSKYGYRTHPITR